EPALGDAALDGHLPALEADEVHVAGAGLLTLATSAGGLAGATGLTAPDPLLFLYSTAARRRQSRQLVHRNSPLRGFALPAFCAALPRKRAASSGLRSLRRPSSAAFTTL